MIIVQCLAVSPHRYKVLGLNLVADQGSFLCGVCSLCACMFPLPALVSLHRLANSLL